MNLSKSKIFFYFRNLKQAITRRGRAFPVPAQDDIDKKLVYSLSPRKIPSGRQFRHLPKFLKPKEYLAVKICLLLIIVNLVYLGIIFINRHLEYFPKAGGTYTEGLVGYPKTINPLYATNRDVDADLSRLIYSSLFVYDADGRLANDLADSYSIGAEGKEYTVKLKDNVFWHNGDRLTADDVIFTFELIKNPAYRSPLVPELTNINAEKIDDETIKFSLGQAYGPFLELLTFGILPKNLWQNISPEAAALNALNLKPVGSGPYKFVSLIKDSAGDLKEYHLTVNLTYYGAKPYLTNIIFKFFPSYPEAIKAFNDNQLDGLGYLPFELRSSLLAQNSLFLHELVRPQIVAVFFNQNKNKSLADKAVRVGLAEALNKDQLIKEAFAGVYVSADGPLPSSSFAYNDALTKYSYDPGAAVDTFKNKPLSLALTVIDSGSNVAVAQAIKTYWEDSGVKVDLKIIPSDQAASIIKNRDFEVLFYGETVGGDPDIYAFWHSTQTGANGLNLAGYANSEADKLLTTGRLSADLDERLAAYKKLQEIITTDLPAIFLYSPTYTYVQTKEVQGFSGTVAVSPADRFAGVSFWYIKTYKKLAW